MGLMNWLMKNGPGSPGDTAKYYVKAYNQITGDRAVNYDQDWIRIFSDLFRHRILVCQKIGFGDGNLLGHMNETQITRMIERSNGDMALFVFQMMQLESRHFRENSVRDEFNGVTSAIHEVIKSRAPLTLKYDLEDFRYYATRAVMKFHEISP